LTKLNPEQNELRQKLYDEGYCDEDIVDRLVRVKISIKQISAN
jgi:hypothetical protein